VLAPDLPGHGDDRTPASAVTLQSYAESVCEIASAQPEPVILAGHSMGGVVITEAAERCPEQVAALAYVCAFLPRNGDSLLTWASQDLESMVNPLTMEMRPDGVAAGFKREYTRRAFYANCSDEDAAFAESSLCDQAIAPFASPVTTTPERWGRIPRYYIECTGDRAITLKLQQEMQKHSPCRQTFSMETDHSPFLSAPEELAEILAGISTA
jgi:pimeloyl-ACP methyl ester carboxylesterase